jgi:heme exporter protein A
VLRGVDLTLWRGNHCLFDGLSFESPVGSAAILRGVNGSGKTTLLRVLCGLTRPETGHVEWQGMRVDANRQLFGTQVAYLGHLSGLKADLSVAQNLAFCARLGGPNAQAWQPLLASLELSHCADLEVRYLSAGQKRRAALARLFMSDAMLWLLDEPFTNLDAAGRQFVEERIVERLQSGGTAIIAAHHDLDLGEVPMQTIELGADA